MIFLIITIFLLFNYSVNCFILNINRRLGFNVASTSLLPLKYLNERNFVDDDSSKNNNRNNENKSHDINHNIKYNRNSWDTNSKLCNEKSYLWKKLKIASLLSICSTVGMANAFDNSEGIDSYKKWDNYFGNSNNNNNFEISKSIKLNKANRPLIYSVELTDPPSLLPRLPEAYDSTLYRLANADCILLSHHNFDPNINLNNDDDFYPLFNLMNNNNDDINDNKDILSMLQYIKSSQSYRDHKLQAQIIEKLLKINNTNNKYSSTTNTIIAFAGLRASEKSYKALEIFINNNNNDDDDDDDDGLKINKINISNDVLELARALIGQWGSEEYNYRYQSIPSTILQNQKQINNFDSKLQISLSLVLSYLPVLNLCKKQGIKIVPVGVPDNIVLKISDINYLNQNHRSSDNQNKGSIDGLSAIQQNKLIKDFSGFVQELTSIGFQRYANQYLLQNLIKYISYPLKVMENSKNNIENINSFKYQYGLWGATLQTDNEKTKLHAKELIQAAAVRDEGSATAIARVSIEKDFDKNNSESNIDNKQIIVLSVVERAIFGYGLQNRIARNFLAYNKPPRNLNTNILETSSSSSSSIDDKNKNRNQDISTNAFYKPTDYQIFSVLLNPSPVDSLSNTGQLRLSLGYAELLPNMKPLANYLWFDESPNIKYLPRVKNGIKKEGEKAPGESSIIGAFGARNGNMAKPTNSQND